VAPSNFFSLHHQFLYIVSAYKNMQTVEEAKTRESPSLIDWHTDLSHPEDGTTHMASAQSPIRGLETAGHPTASRFSSIPEDFEEGDRPPLPENMDDIP